MDIVSQDTRYMFKVDKKEYAYCKSKLCPGICIVSLGSRYVFLIRKKEYAYCK